MSAWAAMGSIRFPLGFAMAVIVVMTLWSAVRLIGPDKADPRTKAIVDGVLFWGAFAAISGVVGTLVGVILSAQAVEAAGAVHPTLVWGGIKVSLISSALGFIVLGFSSIIWFGLQFRYRVLDAREEGY